MAARYVITVRVDFSGAHQLHGYDGPCARMHGHNWWVEAEVETTVLDGVGMGVDFREVKQALRAVTEVLDHRVLNEIPPFTEVNPTAENVAAYFADRVARDLRGRHPGRPIRVRAITLWETDHSAVRYEPDPPGDA